MRAIAAVISIVICLSVANPIIVHAQDAERQKSAIELIKESRVLDSIDHVMRATMNQVAVRIKNRNQNITDETMNVIMDEAIKGLNNQKPAFLIEMANLYAKYFTVEEMNDMTAFYQTPAGQKSISVLPQLTVEAMQLGDQWAKAALPEVLQGIKKRLEEEGHTL